MTAASIVVYGATGLVGGRVCTALDAAEVPFIAAGRRKLALDKLATLVEPAAVRVAEIDHAALVKAFAGASVVINCAGPLAARSGQEAGPNGSSTRGLEMGETVLVAALEAGAHYIDIGGDQMFLHDMYERHESAARKAGRVVVPGCGVNCALGDWGAAWAALHVCGAVDEGDVVRGAPAVRLGEDKPLDSIAVSYLFDDLVLSPASQKAVFGNLHTRGLVWRRDRWEQVTPGIDRKRVNAGPSLGGEREAVSFPGGDVITVPRHIATASVQTYLSMTRSQVASTALRLLARAMPFVPKRATELLAPYQPAEDEYARSHFAVVAQARRGFSAAQIVVSGTDQYRASAGIAAWVAQKLAVRATGPVGMRAPSELFRAPLALRSVADSLGLSVEPSFG